MTFTSTIRLGFFSLSMINEVPEMILADTLDDFSYSNQYEVK